MTTSEPVTPSTRLRFPISLQRSDASALKEAAETIQADKLLMSVLEAIPSFAMVLDENRQIVAANRRLLDAVGAQTLQEIMGQRPGEAVHCRHACRSPEECGSTAACVFCGAVQAIVISQQTQTTQVQECRIPLMNSKEGAIDAEVSASPIFVGGKCFTLATMRDISSEKRRKVLERVFFHDVLNTAGGMQGLVAMLRDKPSMEAGIEYVELLQDLCERLVEAIGQQRELLAAETGELVTRPVFVSVRGLLESIQKVYERHEIAGGRKVVLGQAPDIDIVTDANLARRVVENMVKNALEASARGATVTLDAQDQGEQVALRVHNPSVIPDAIKHQIFQRSFSTKGSDRGIGTYSMRLLGEGYLGGKVSFTSSEPSGTTFVFRIPKTWAGRPSDESW